MSQVSVNGAEKPAVRVQIDPVRLAAAGLSAQDVYAAVRAANVLEPEGGFQGPLRAETIGANGQIDRATDYRQLVLKAGGGAVLRLSDVATVVDGTANARLGAWDGRTPAILLLVQKLAGDANAIQTADGVASLLPQLMRWLPPEIRVSIIADRTTTIRASVASVEDTLLVTVGLVLMVVLLFMRRAVPTIAAAVTVPLSICGTLAAMWLLGFALDNFSLMALTISVGFVVDDAIVMIENIVRFRDMGLTPMQAALQGSRQIGFTVVSISVSLVAVFIPLLFMGGIMGQLMHEFATTLTVAIGVSAVVSLTLTPMICARFISADDAPPRGLWGRIDRAVDGAFRRLRRGYARQLDWALRHNGFMLAVTLAVIVLTVRLYGSVPGGLRPGPGHRAAARPDLRLAGRVVRRDVGAPATGCGRAAGRPGGRQGAVHRRRLQRLGVAEPRPAHHRLEAGRRAPRHGRRGDRAAARAAEGDQRGAGRTCGRRRTCAAAAAPAARPTRSR